MKGVTLFGKYIWQFYQYDVFVCSIVMELSDEGDLYQRIQKVASV
jgi:hypothetical protein